MFIIPFERAIDPRRPPLVTMLLVLINCLIYFGFQGGDDQRLAAAAAFYVKSELPAIEFPAWLERRTGEERARLAGLSQKQPELLLFALQRDRRFLVELRADRVITPEDERYSRWRAARSQFDALWLGSRTQAYAFDTGDPRPLTLFTSMFLHGDAGHLIGNMVVLVLVGLAVELALGSLLYLGFYLVSGVAATALFWAAHLHDPIAVLGASGAISGVMALYAVLFGRRRIRFFYSLLFYFDYVKAPAWIMLFLWLGNECFQLLAGGPGQVAYEAHIGGLIAGALLGVAAKLRGNLVDESFLNAGAEAERRRRSFERGLALVADLQVEKGIALFKGLHEEQPEDLEVLLQLYKVAGLRPGSDEHHYAAGALLSAQYDARLTPQQSHDIFAAYLTATQGKTRLPLDRLLTLARRFAKAGFPETAERVLLALARRRAELPGLAEAFSALAEAWRRRGDEARRAACEARARQLVG